MVSNCNTIKEVTSLISHDDFWHNFLFDKLCTNMSKLKDISLQLEKIYRTIY